MNGWVMSVSTASDSSSGAVSVDSERSCQAPFASSPAAVTRRTLNPRWTRWTATDAAIEDYRAGVSNFIARVIRA